MFFWFVGLSFVFVAWVFASPAIDYRLVAVGSVVPVVETIDYRLVAAGSVAPLVEMLADGPWVLHTLLAPAAAMTIVMLVFMGRRLKQRRWLGLPIGMFMYLVLDGAWARTELFWWPVFGLNVDQGDLPTWESPGVIVIMELIGLAAIGYAVRRYRLAEPEARMLLVREGRLTRAAMGHESSSMVVTTSTKGTPAMTPANRSGRKFMTAPINRPPALPPWA